MQPAMKESVFPEHLDGVYGDLKQKHMTETQKVGIRNGFASIGQCLPCSEALLLVDHKGTGNGRRKTVVQ